jgi:hypothetical protein
MQLRSRARLARLALSSDGSIWAWGLNDAGQVGVGTFQNDYLTPQHVLPPVGYRFTSVEAGSLGLHDVAMSRPFTTPSELVSPARPRVAMVWLNTGTGSLGDTNGDGIVNGLDISLIATDWLHTIGGGAVSGAAAVPEPGTVIPLSLGFAILVAWRSRRRTRASV